MRLALLWHGAFIDAARHWTARGAGFEKPLGDKVLHLPDGSPFARLPDVAAPWPKKLSKEQNSPPSIGTGLDPFAQPPKDFVEDSDLRFRGYWLDKNKRPIFRYEWHDLRVRDEFKPVGEHDLYVIQRTLTFTGAGRGWFRIARSPKID